MSGLPEIGDDLTKYLPITWGLGFKVKKAKEIPYQVHVQRRGSLAWIAKSPKQKKVNP